MKMLGLDSRSTPPNNEGPPFEGTALPLSSGKRRIQPCKTLASTVLLESAACGV